MQAFTALSSNHYTRFFRLVRSAPLLQACILHRYFMQARSRALLAIVRAYTPPKHTVLVSYGSVEVVEGRVCGCIRARWRISAQVRCKLQQVAKYLVFPLPFSR